MDFLFAMSIFSSAADISREKGKAQEWLRAPWVVARDGIKGGGGDSAERGETRRRRRQEEPRAHPVRGTQEKKRQQVGRPLLAPEFDGINCFETIVLH